MTQLLAFYLPQYHPIDENDEWWGPGFTEWTNVASARPLFRGHYQPRLPGELGFYDLRLEQTRVDQAELAMKYGVSGFLYWHYWFGRGKRLLDLPFREVVVSKKPNFPFALAWANHSWERKSWSPNVRNKLLIRQEYLGEEDYRDHFLEMLTAFQDERYIKVDGKLLFVIFNPLQKEVSDFIDCWRSISVEYSLPGFYFVGRDFNSRNKKKILAMGFDSIYNDDVFNIHHHLSPFKKLIFKIKRDFFKMPTVFKYNEAIDYMITADCKNDEVIPVIAPNWDHSPRSGRKSIILKGESPLYFGKLVSRALRVVENKTDSKRIVFIKSWNEWGEGNYLEPDRISGRDYLKMLKNVIDQF